ncbi:subtilisin-like protease SBT4.6 [Papaver somniferum]|uniref:subtilisin-like protease SBT4.6 n=1 Tax=Papaver somniferum TaxID=3469 RepID=UPI000E6FD228|nr:subtilisin-like protease SBT4.6 [Papaver somniferum]
MGDLPSESEYTPMSHHQNILQDILDGNSVQDTLVHSYKRSFNGFSAKLTEKEVEKLSGMDGIVSIFPNRIYQLQTTRSWDFIGLPEDVKRMPTVESDTIIGLLDTGIWPESESFSDVGFGPPPKKWKGVCDGGHNFTCNNKLIGARYYNHTPGNIESARDTQGHGTHTSSTAAGNIVKGAGFYEIAKGNARGAVPSARIAAYKVCFAMGCTSDAILAGFDDAISDGVDILSVSLGGTEPASFETDPVAIGSFHAMKKGVLTSHSAGNSGPQSQTVSSNAPWLLTVAASSTDRRVIDKIVLGNGKTIQGLGVNGFKLPGNRFPLLHGYNVSTICTPLTATACDKGCLDKDLVKGKIVICDTHIASEPFTSGALGTILISDPAHTRFDVSSVYPLPAALINTTNGDLLKSYFRSTRILLVLTSFINFNRNPIATILRTESIKDFEAPVVASFSSRGPNQISPDIIKPDISAPGVNILAAYSPVASPSDTVGDTRSVKYNIISGTSMACPHATGAAAYVKTHHPDWSPSAIKSALMTTAFAMNNTKNSGAEFAYGSGQIDPVKALNPGLVYDAHADDYVQYLCGMGYDSSKVKLITNSTCPGGRTTPDQPRNLNYPSFGAHVEEGKKINLKFTRTVTNVDTTSSTYKVKITSDDRITVAVEPQVLSFKSLNENKSFVVTVVGDAFGPDEMATASLVWSDEGHIVRSPIVVYSQAIL